MTRGSLPARSAVGLVAGLVLGPWLAPSAGGIAGIGGADEADDPAGAWPPVPRSVWLYSADSTALPAVHARIDRVLDNVAGPNQRQLTDIEVRVHVVPRDQDITELPPWRELRGQRVPDGDPADPYPEARTYDQVRGLGPPTCAPGPLDIGIGEEQVAVFPDGAHHSPHTEDLGRNLVHELGHAVECSLTADQHEALTTSYTATRRRYPEGVVGAHPAYTVSSPREYFAEGTAAWFGTGEDGTYRRSWLAEHDPKLHHLLADVFGVPSPTPSCDGRVATSVLTAGDAPFAGTPGPDVVVGSDGADVVNGGGGADVVCGGGGADRLYGGYGPDRLFGGPGEDSLVGGTGDLCSQDPTDPVEPCGGPQPARSELEPSGPSD